MIAQTIGWQESRSVSRKGRNEDSGLVFRERLIEQLSKSVDDSPVADEIREIGALVGIKSDTDPVANDALESDTDKNSK